MKVDQEAVKNLKLYSLADDTEADFKFRLKCYGAYELRPYEIQKRVLTDNEFFTRFSFKYNYNSTDSKTLLTSQEDINYYLEKNFILNRYLQHKEYEINFSNPLYHHYLLLLTRNFEDIPLSLQTNAAIKPYLADLYMNSLYQKKDLAEEIMFQQPDKVEEVSSLLYDYIQYYKNGVIRPSETLTEEQINKPYVYQKTVSV